jgi:hypothetical protein
MWERPTHRSQVCPGCFAMARAQRVTERDDPTQLKLRPVQFAIIITNAINWNKRCRLSFATAV